MAHWTWAAASRRGTAHERAGEKRQDAFRIVSSEHHGFLVLVACDGAGSAEHGGHGARVAARVLGSCAALWLSAARRLPDADVAACWVLLAREAVRSAASRRGLDERGFATTAVLAVSNGASTLTVHVGDGAVVARSADDGGWIALSWPEAGEYAGTTRFLTDEDGPACRIGLHDRAVDRVVVMTDGVERLALDFASGTPHAPFLEPMCAPLAHAGTRGRDPALSGSLAAFLSSDQVNVRTDDDKTLLLASLA